MLLLWKYINARYCYQSMLTHIIVIKICWHTLLLSKYVHSHYCYQSILTRIIVINECKHVLFLSKYFNTFFPTSTIQINKTTDHVFYVDVLVAAITFFQSINETPPKANEYGINTSRRSLPGVFLGKGVLKICRKFTQ